MSEDRDNEVAQGCFLPYKIRDDLVNLLMEELPMKRVENVVNVLRNLPNVRVPKQNVGD